MWNAKIVKRHLSTQEIQWNILSKVIEKNMYFK